MKQRSAAYILLIALLLPVVLALTACGTKPEDQPPQMEIIEPGLTEEHKPEPGPGPDTTEEPTPEQPDFALPADEDFVDMGRASTLDDLMTNKEKIKSYYFEQTISSVAGDTTMKTWYKDDKMKIVSSFPGAPINIEYYDCKTNTIITHTPATGGNAMRMSFDAGDPNLPDNPLEKDYHDFRVLETDSINGQLCRVLESKQGEKLWISTKLGFPLQVEFTDPTNDEHLIVTYENIAINQVQEADVALPDGLAIFDMSSGWGGAGDYVDGANADEYPMQTPQSGPLPGLAEPPGPEEATPAPEPQTEPETPETAPE